MQSMLRTLASAALALGITGSLSAQIICYESQIGSSIGIGDDTVLPIQSLGFAFPFNGGTFTDVHAVTNGFVYLSNAGVPAPGGSLCCTGSTASLVAGSPKICPRLDDLNILAANSAGVYFNAMPGKAVVTWVNAVEFSNTVPFTMQLQLFATGEIVMFYSPNVTARTAGDALVGFSPGNGAVVPTASDLSVAGNSTVNTIFQIFNNGGTANWDLGGTSVLFVPNGAGYTWLNLPCAAFHETYGAGCYDRGGSVYENFSGSGSFDLSGQTLTAVPAGGGYFWNTAPVGTLFPGATNLNLTDDSLSAAIPLNTPFPYQGGTATQIIVCSNGRIFLSGTGNATYLTSVAAYLSDDPSVGMWFDFNPTAGGQVQADFDAANNQEVVTWNGVFAFGTTSANTVQIVLSLQGSAVPGQVEFRFQTFTNNSSTNTSQAIVGFSHGIA